MAWLPPGREWAETYEDELALAAFMGASDQALSLDRHSVRDPAAEQFDTDRIVDSIINAVNSVGLGVGIERAANV